MSINQCWLLRPFREEITHNCIRFKKLSTSKSKGMSSTREDRSVSFRFIIHIWNNKFLFYIFNNASKTYIYGFGIVYFNKSFFFLLLFLFWFLIKYESKGEEYNNSINLFKFFRQITIIILKIYIYIYIYNHLH